MAVLQCTGAVLASVSILYWKLTSITPLHSPATSLTLVSHICLHSGLIIATQHSPAQLHNSLEIKRFPLRLFVISFHWSLTFLHRYRYIHAFIVLNLSIQFYDVTPLSWYYDVKIGKSNPALLQLTVVHPSPVLGAVRRVEARPAHLTSHAHSAELRPAQLVAGAEQRGAGHGPVLAVIAVCVCALVAVLAVGVIRLRAAHNSQLREEQEVEMVRQVYT